MVKTPVPAQPAAPKAEDKPAAQTPPAPEQAPEHEVEQAEKPLGTIPARILVDHGDHKSNTLALLTEAEAANCGDWADTSVEAVEYVASQTDPAELERLKAAYRADD